MNVTAVGSVSVVVTKLAKELHLYPLQYAVVHDHHLYLVCPDLFVAVGETC